MQTKIKVQNAGRIQSCLRHLASPEGKLEFFNYASVHFFDNICIDCSFRQNLVLCEELHENIPKLQL